MNITSAPFTAIRKIKTEMKTNLTLLAAAALLLFACTPSEINPQGTNPEGGNHDTEPSVVEEPVSSTTVGAEHVSAVSAILKGKAVVKSDPESTVYGFQYYKLSGSSSTVMTIVSTNKDDSFSYSVAITGLEPSTTYKYWSFVRQNGRDIFGKPGELTTKGIETLLETKEATDRKGTSVTLNAGADLTDVGFAYKEISYGFLWGTSESALDAELESENIKENKCSAVLTGLTAKTQYWYKAYVKLDDQVILGKVMSFTTGVVPVESVSLDITEYRFSKITTFDYNKLIIKATVYPADATNKNLIWTSSDPCVVQVYERSINTAEINASENGTSVITVKTVDQGKTAECKVVVAIPVSSVELDRTSIKLNAGEEFTLMPTIKPSSAADKSLSWTSSDTSVAIVDNTGMISGISKGRAIITAAANDGSNKSAACEVIVRSKYQFEAIDLGLSVKWANGNIGAKHEEESGTYYAWGETLAGNPRFNFQMYKFGGNIDYAPNKYNNTDKKTVLEPKDDVASVAFGDKWRMPTEAEWTELITNCTCVWVDNYEDSGINGLQVAAKNGNSIFLPAAGQGGHIMTGPVNVCTEGMYWSSSLALGTGVADWAPVGCCAWHVTFSSDNAVKLAPNFRCFGYSVRAVCDKEE